MKESKRLFENTVNDIPGLRFQAVGEEDLEGILRRARERGGEAAALARDEHPLSRDTIKKIIRILKAL